jgi:UDP:flavonoid glycosyltransferase YjiC (YdhE family)
MRVICTAVPGSGLFLPTVPLAWALRAAGHEVLLLTNGAGARAAANAGLPVVDPLPDRDLWAEFLAGVTARRAAATASGGPPAGPRPGTGFGFFGEQLIDGMLPVARAFRPDLVIGTLEQGAAPLIATALDVPLVEQSVRIATAGNDEHSVRFRDAIAGHLDPVRERLGLTTVPPRVLTLDVRPPSLGGTAAANQWLMRYVPYNGSRVLPASVLEPAGRPRVCVTLGSVVPEMGGIGWLRALVTDLADLDAEILLALGDIDLTDLGDLPPNVRALGWMPLNAVLPGCAAIVHHGGSATVATPFVLGVPQLALPQGADQPLNAKLVADSGAGLSLDDPADARDALSRLLTDPTFAANAAKVAADIAAQPSPADIAARLPDLI